MKKPLTVIERYEIALEAKFRAEQWYENSLKNLQKRNQEFARAKDELRTHERREGFTMIRFAHE